MSGVTANLHSHGDAADSAAAVSSLKQKVVQLGNLRGLMRPLEPFSHE